MFVAFHGWVKEFFLSPKWNFHFSSAHITHISKAVHNFAVKISTFLVCVDDMSFYV